MANYEHMLYFSKDANERGVYPVRNFLGIDMVDDDADSIHINFLKEDGSADAALVTLTVDTTGSSIKHAAEVLAGALAGQSSTRGITIIADTENNKYMYPFTAIESIT
tara:strand:+ start:28 stop:351 length:324 start_codon:yes stop_codon:yes gene_type:complete